MRPIYEDFSHVISPITGKIRFDGVQDLTEDYTWIGDSNDNSFQSPILIDIRLDLIELRTILDKTTPSGFILQTKNDILPNSQALDELSNGFLYNTHGILSSAIPGEGTIALPEGNVFVGDSNNLASAQQLISINNLPDLQANTISIGPITYGIWEMWQGTNPGRPQASYSVSTTLAQIDFAFKSTNWIIGKSGIVPGALSYPEAQFLDQLPDNRILTHEGNGVIGVASLSFKKIFRGNASAVPEESNDLTTLEDKVTFIEDVKIPAIESEISTIEGQITAIEGQITFIEGEITLLQGAVVVLQGQVAGLLLSVASLSGRVDTLESKVSTLETNVATLQSQVSVIQGQIVVIQGQIIAINTRIDNLRLNTILADGDVSFYNFKLITLADPLNPQDGVNLRTMQAAISGAVGNISLDGFVLGDSDENGLIHTTRGSLCLLTNIPAGGNVSLDNFRITNLGDYEADRDALSIEGFWDLIHHPDLFVARINPEAHILGAVQQFVFDLPYSVFQIQNTFIPTNLIPSENIEEFRNSNNSGYRLVQETASPSNSGDFYLEKFLNGEEDGEKILSFEESTDQLTLEKILNANNQRIVNVTEEPAADQDTISFIYLWRVLNDEVF